MSEHRIATDFADHKSLTLGLPVRHKTFQNETLEEIIEKNGKSDFNFLLPIQQRNFVQTVLQISTSHSSIKNGITKLI